MLALDWSIALTWAAERALRLGLIVAVAWLCARVATRALPRLVRAAIDTEGRSPDEVQKRIDTVVHVGDVTVRWAIGLLAGFSILSEVGIDITPILAGAGIVGIAVGFGAQSLVRDVLAGVVILVENQYGQGDVVAVAGVSGLVERVNLRRTVLRDLDGAVHSIPNGQIAVASNFTREYSRVNLNVTVSYAEDLDRVFAVIDGVGRELAEDEAFGPLILKAPQALRVDAFAESGVVIKILGDTKPLRQWDVMGELRRRLKRAFDENGIEIPLPHRVIITRSGQSDVMPPQREN